MYCNVRPSVDRKYTYLYYVDTESKTKHPEYGVKLTIKDRQTPTTTTLESTLDRRGRERSSGRQPSRSQDS